MATYFPLPTTVNPSDHISVCVPVPDESGHRQAFLGALYNLTRWYSWQRDSTNKAKDVANVWLEIYRNVSEQLALSELTCMTNQLDVRQNEALPCVLEKSTDNGETWLQFANLQLCPPKIRISGGKIQISLDGGVTWVDADTVDGYDERFDGDFEIPYPDNPNGNCLAAENIVSVFNDAMTSARAQAIAGSGVTAIASAVSGVASFFIAPAVFVSAAFGIASAIFAAGSAFVDDVISTGNLDKFKCAVYQNINTDGSMTASQFSAMRSQLAGIDGAAEQLIYELWVDGLGSVGLTRQAKASSITSGSCDCNWTHVFDFTSSNGDFEAYPADEGDGCSPVNSPYTANGWGFFYCSSINAGYIEVIRHFDARTITFAEIKFNSSLSGDCQIFLEIVGSGETVVRSQSFSAGSIASNVSGSWVANGVRARIGVSGNPSGYLTELTLSGLGVDPFN